MKSPNKEEIINVLGKDYTLRYTDEIGTCGAMGNANRSRQFMNVNVDGLALQQVESTVLHEVIHVIDGELKIGLTEEDVARLEVGLYSAGYRRAGGYKP